MHGQKRSDYKALQRDPKFSRKMEEKAAKWYLLMDQLNEQPDLTLPMTEKCLVVNPDPLDLWNRRRDHLKKQDVSMSFDLDTELSLTQNALESNPKAYGAWHHRKWALTIKLWDNSVYEKELLLTELFLKRDERNFHCWNYRRFIVACFMKSMDGSWEGNTMGRQISKELSNDSHTNFDQVLLKSEFDFTTTKIQDNFSNYSAFHYRSKLLPLVENFLELQESELELVENAVFTEPDDQSAWWYHRFLLDFYSWTAPILNTHLQNLNELREESPGCKWVYLALIHVYEIQGVQIEKPELLNQLILIDPDRAGRYNAMLRESASNYK